MPKLGVDVNVVYDEKIDSEDSYQKALEKGVVRYGAAISPGDVGNLVIGGHSSNNIFNPGGYKYVFSNLRLLEAGDIIFLNFEGKRYTYQVQSRQTIKPDDPSAAKQTRTATLTLFTCDPPGTDINRLIIKANLIDPEPTQKNNLKDSESLVLPNGEPSIWQTVF